jgi:hypothetical protein
LVGIGPRRLSFTQQAERDQGDVDVAAGEGRIDGCGV